MLTRILRTGAAVPAGLLVATGAVTLPGAALVACVALGVVAWRTRWGPGGHPADVALRRTQLHVGSIGSRSEQALHGTVALTEQECTTAGAGSPLGGLWQLSGTATDRPACRPVTGTVHRTGLTNTPACRFAPQATRLHDCRRGSAIGTVIG